ncbi:hypothetical protein [Orrella daihaiensis]|uniref:Uncharacterized protein n=1 Tax=Orrella daihaiensis TaxID=2782176 RepID=A0ABY4AM78_9BURK|nr:hypothetical protein [Orrella daihaiensis]UOD51419.1 hypothetical protein DHf2319_06230 [Orrella daihaiensis]
MTTNTAAGWKYPGQYDYRSIDKLIEQSSANHHCWQIDDYVDIHGNRRASLRFDVISADGALGFGFTNNGSLSAWPYWLSQPPGTDQQLRLVPPKAKEHLDAFMLGLQSLSTSDWRMLKTLCDLMISQYAVLMMVDRQWVSWFKGLQQLAKLLAAVPTTLRFDRVDVTRVVQQEGYAHLGLSLSNVMTGRGTFEGWEFHLATVQANGVFDANPRLEFGRGRGETVFERWFVESSNAFGDKLEVRFAKQDQLVDLPLVMVRLTDADRQVIAQLVEQLPLIVSRASTQSAPALVTKLGQEGLKLFGPFSQVAQTMRSIWRLQVGAA